MRGLASLPPDQFSSIAIGVGGPSALNMSASTSQASVGMFSPDRDVLAVDLHQLTVRAFQLHLVCA